MLMRVRWARPSRSSLLFGFTSSKGRDVFCLIWFGGGGGEASGSAASELDRVLIVTPF